MKVWIVYRTGVKHADSKYEISAPTGWDFMTREERNTWARNVITRKDSSWTYVQIDGFA